MEVCVRTLQTPVKGSPASFTCAVILSHEFWLWPRSLVWPWHGAVHALPTPGAGACYIRSVKLWPLLPSPRGQCPGSSPSVTGRGEGVDFTGGTQCPLSRTGKGAEGKRKLPSFTCLRLLCPSRGQRTTVPNPPREGHLGSVRARWLPSDQPCLLGFGLGGVTPVASRVPPVRSHSES